VCEADRWTVRPREAGIGCTPKSGDALESGPKLQRTGGPAIADGFYQILIDRLRLVVLGSRELASESSPAGFHEPRRAGCSYEVDRKTGIMNWY
jgi:hypothetical protein